MGFEKNRGLSMAGMVGARTGMPVRHIKGKTKKLTVVVKKRRTGGSRNVAEAVSKQHKAVIRDKGFMSVLDKVNGYGYALLRYK